MQIKINKLTNGKKTHKINIKTYYLFKDKNIYIYIYIYYYYFNHCSSNNNKLKYLLYQYS